MNELQIAIDEWAGKQSTFDDTIYRKFKIGHQKAFDLIDEKLLALKVEIGEAANEFRGFKFWSLGQNARVDETISCKKCRGNGSFNFKKCKECQGEGQTYGHNLLLEELIDCLKFTISIGLTDRYLLELDTGKRLYYVDAAAMEDWAALQWSDKPGYKKMITKQFNRLFNNVTKYETEGRSYGGYLLMLQELLNLCGMLGYELQDLIAAFDAKGAKNFNRLEAGY